MLVVENKVQSSATVWRLPDQPRNMSLALDTIGTASTQISTGNLPELERMAELGGHDGVVKRWAMLQVVCCNRGLRCASYL